MLNEFSQGLFLFEMELGSIMANSAWRNLCMEKLEYFIYSWEFNFREFIGINFVFTDINHTPTK